MTMSLKCKFLSFGFANGHCFPQIHYYEALVVFLGLKKLYREKCCYNICKTLYISLSGKHQDSSSTLIKCSSVNKIVYI